MLLMKKHFYLYGLILILGVLISTLLPGWITSPSSNFTILTQNSHGISQTTFKSRAGYLKFLPRSYVLVLYSGNESNFRPVEYITITRMNGSLVVELIEGAGTKNVRVLKGSDAETYLTNHDIDIRDLDNELQRRN